ncbi:MAG: hypothetical protein ACR2PM_03795 [Hyphomicrobiales bacterium]
MSIFSAAVDQLSSLFGRRDHKFESLVVLLPGPRDLFAHHLWQALEELFPAAFTGRHDTDDPHASFVTAGMDSEPPYLVKSLAEGHSGLFLIHLAGQPYIDPDEFRGDDFNDEIKSGVATHKAWFSVDRLESIGSDEDVSRFIRVLCAKLAPHDALCVLDPGKKGIAEFSDDVRTCLAAGADIFGGTPS